MKNNQWFRSEKSYLDDLDMVIFDIIMTAAWLFIILSMLGIIN